MYMDKNVADLYEVVVNIEGQYSIWAAAKAVPAGWDKVGCSGSKDACLAYIRDNWTDMRPASLRQAMDAQAA